MNLLTACFLQLSPITNEKVPEPVWWRLKAYVIQLRRLERGRGKLALTKSIKMKGSLVKRKGDACVVMNPETRLDGKDCLIRKILTAKSAVFPTTMKYLNEKMDEYILPRAIMIWARINACYVRKLATFRIVIRTADIQEWLDVSHIRQKTGTDLL
ncbi:unnamed protein product [Albugo candida]|uniref:Uncharacterized protein n=1 Tax=Albugo candida TaxID=65357 RepID=A0A024G060_9STRA|nr:unnamed protein product [Albugo candida]|eukprot:CCI39908.1 unnamed protein product [Albugo candida]